jgi:hypothetical protein
MKVCVTYELLKYLFQLPKYHKKMILSFFILRCQLYRVQVKEKQGKEHVIIVEDNIRNVMEGIHVALVKNLEILFNVSMITHPETRKY